MKILLTLFVLFFSSSVVAEFPNSLFGIPLFTNLNGWDVTAYNFDENVNKVMNNKPVLVEENRRNLKKGTAIYLETSIQTQLERTINDNKRPLLQGSSNREQTLIELKKFRDPLFQKCANITIKEAKNSHNEVVEEIIDRLKLM